MNEFSTAELTRMQATQTAAMQDTCIVQACAETADVYGAPVPAYTDGTAQACGFNPLGAAGRLGGGERKRADGTLLIVDATLRLPITATIAVKDRVKITHRFGVALTTALTFEVVGLPRRGPSGLVIELESVT